MTRSLLLLACALALISCGRHSPQDRYAEGREAERKGDLAAAARAYKDAVGASTETAYAESCQFRLAHMYLVPEGDKHLAAAEQARFYRLFPASKDAPGMLFLAAFTYNNDLHQTDSARALYAAFLERYPDHDLAGSARYELQNLGKSADELLTRADSSASPAKALPR